MKISSKFSFTLCVLTLLFGLLSAYLIFVSTYGIKYPVDKHLILLSERLLVLKVSLSPYNLPSGDVVDYFGNLYLYFGPAPSIFLLPFVRILGQNFPQVTIGITSLIFVFILVYKIGRKLLYSFENSIWLSIFFCFSTVLLSVSIVNITAFQIQAFGTVFVFLSIYEFLSKRRWWLIGIFIGIAGLTRFTLYGAAVFFALEILLTRIPKSKLLYLFLPIFISFILYGSYNYRRFHSVFETGYKFNVTLKNYPMSSNMKFGFLSLNHVPANLYVLLLKPPEPIFAPGGGYVLKFPYLKAEPWGMALWWTSPLFVFLFQIKRRKYVLLGLITSAILLIPSLLYSGIGFIQYGYRYSLDFLPFLFLSLIASFDHELLWRHKIAIVIGVTVMGLLLGSLWGAYPYFGIK